MVTKIRALLHWPDPYVGIGPNCKYYFLTESCEWYGPYASWRDANLIFMMYCIDRQGVGDQDLLYADLNKILQ